MKQKDHPLPIIEQEKEEKKLSKEGMATQRLQKQVSIMETAAAVRTHQALLGSKATDCITDMRTEVHGQDGGVYNHGVS